VEKTVDLVVKRRRNSRIAMANVQTADPARHIEKRVAIDIMDTGAFSALNENRS
jgi:hypothetical protein